MRTWLSALFLAAPLLAPTFAHAGGTSQALRRAERILDTMDARSLAHTSVARGSLKTVTANARYKLAHSALVGVQQRGSVTRLQLANGDRITVATRPNGNHYASASSRGAFRDLQHAEVGASGLVSFYSATGVVSDRPASAQHAYIETGKPGSRSTRWYQADTEGVTRFVSKEHVARGGAATTEMSKVARFPRPFRLP